MERKNVDNKRVLKWYYVSKGELPTDKERCNFDIKKDSVTRLGTFYKTDSFNRPDMFISTEGAHFHIEEVEAWIPISELHSLRLAQLENDGLIYSQGQAVLPIRDEEKAKRFSRLILDYQTDNKHLLDNNLLYKEYQKEHFKLICDLYEKHFSQPINTISDATDYKTLYEREVECVDFMKNVEKEYLAEIERLKNPVSISNEDIVSHLIKNCKERIISIDKVITEPDVKFARINEVETFKNYLEIIQKNNQ